MRYSLEERACDLAVYIVENRATVRAAAKKFGVSKSTVHKDLTERLPHVNPGLIGRCGRCWISTRRSGISAAGLPPGANIRANDTERDCLKPPPAVPISCQEIRAQRLSQSLFSLGLRIFT